MKNYKKPLLIALLVLDVAITVFLLTISIIMIVKIGTHNRDPQAAAAASGPMIAFFIKNPNLFLGLCVVPLFALLAANIVGLVVYVRKTSKKEPAKLEDLSEEQKEALRQELLKDLKGNGEDKKD